MSSKITLPDDIANSIEEMKKNLANLCNQTNVSIDNFQKILDSSLDTAIKKFNTATEQVITVQSNSSDQTVWFQAKISALGSITYELPKERPSENDLYWKTFDKQVNDAVSLRKDLLLKIIETVGSTISGLVGSKK